MEKKINKSLYWAPRILAIIFILFLALFSLDVFAGNYGFWEAILALLIHNIPVFILTGLLIISWKHEIVGAVVFILVGILYIALLLRTILMNLPYQWYMLSWSVQVAGPAFLIGILFLIGWFKKKK